MMQAADINCSDANGLVADFVKKGQFDIIAFENAWNENKAIENY